jgi:hypothetical protein
MIDCPWIPCPFTITYNSFSGTVAIKKNNGQEQAKLLVKRVVEMQGIPIEHLEPRSSLLNGHQLTWVNNSAVRFFRVISETKIRRAAKTRTHPGLALVHHLP